MTDQLTIRLPADLRDALDAAALASQRKRAEIVRLALREFLEIPPAAGPSPSSRVRGLVGSLDSGVSDLAEKHREYLLATLQQGE
jgi:metal-responsive CopG/Arc/MetJ family transcriptional regulator